jgi:hypothetical protein
MQRGYFTRMAGKEHRSMRTQRKGVKTLLLLGITGTLSRFFPRCSAAAVPSREERRPWHEGSCTSPLRIIVSPRKPSKMPPIQPVLEGARPWSHTFFITNSPCWHSYGSSFCCLSLGPSRVYSLHPCQRSPSANAPPSPHRLRASRTGLTVLCVSKRPCVPTHLPQCRPIPCPQRTDAPGR